MNCSVYPLADNMFRKLGENNHDLKYEIIYFIISLATYLPEPEARRKKRTLRSIGASFLIFLPCYLLTPHENRMKQTLREFHRKTHCLHSLLDVHYNLKKEIAIEDLLSMLLLGSPLRASGRPVCGRAGWRKHVRPPF